jgi:curli biogenesis system outer membrane secretion channel CsgG
MRLRLREFFGTSVVFSATLFPVAVSGQQGECSKRACVAVVDIVSEQPCEYFAGRWGSVFNCNTGWTAFRSIVEAELVKPQKLIVVERSELSAAFDEQQLQYFVKSGGKLNFKPTTSAVSFLVYGKVTELGYEEKGYSDSTVAISSLIGTFAADIKVVDVKTGRIKRAESVRVTENLGSQTATTGTRAGQTKSLNALYGVLQRKAAEQIARALTLSVVPMTVVQVDGDTVYLNYGGSFLQNGLELDVKAPGKELVDPNTGRVLGSSSRPVGKVRVESVYPEYSIARITQGLPTSFAAGNLAEFPQGQQPINDGMPPKVDLP